MGSQGRTLRLLNHGILGCVLTTAHAANKSKEFLVISPKHEHEHVGKRNITMNP